MKFSTRLRVGGVRRLHRRAPLPHHPRPPLPLRSGSACSEVHQCDSDAAHPRHRGFGGWGAKREVARDLCPVSAAAITRRRRLHCRESAGGGAGRTAQAGCAGRQGTAAVESGGKGWREFETPCGDPAQCRCRPPPAGQCLLLTPGAAGDECGQVVLQTMLRKEQSARTYVSGPGPGRVRREERRAVPAEPA